MTANYQLVDETIMDISDYLRWWRPMPGYLVDA